MTKHTLDFEIEYDFILIGINCHQKDYKICWALNQTLGIKMERQEGHVLQSEKGLTESNFSNFKFEDEDNKNTFHLFKNKSANGVLIPEQKFIDYLLKIDHDETFEIDDLVNTIKSIDFVLTAYQLDVDNLTKSKENLIL